jgi:hypothetical protein
MSFSAILLFPRSLGSIYAKNIGPNERLYRWGIEKHMGSILDKRDDPNLELGKPFEPLLVRACGTAAPRASPLPWFVSSQLLRLFHMYSSKPYTSFK